MIEDFRLRVFVTLASEKSFTKAASVLGVSQPAVSQNISELEKQCGVKLFDRLRAEVVLTTAGEIFHDKANEILMKYHDLSQMFMRFPDTIVRVAASDEVFNYLTVNLLGSFLQVHPEVRFELAFIPDNADLKVSLVPIKENRGTLALSYRPSASFASTRLYKVLSEIIL
jgi:DNA-binding transcriptional LysR family regulator